jgi:hypothetical protein
MCSSCSGGSFANVTVGRQRPVVIRKHKLAKAGGSKAQKQRIRAAKLRAIARRKRAVRLAGMM